MKTKFLSVLTLAVINTFILHAIGKEMKSDHSMFIYGQVITDDGDIYKGQIRWGKEEAFWFDMFNSSKPDNDNLKWLSDDELDALNKKDKVNKDSWYNWGNSWSSDNAHTHSFKCQFGDIKSIKPLRKSKVILELKNGDVYTLKGGSNDIGTRVLVNDSDLGKIKLDWDRIDKIEFMSTPSNLDSTLGEPLYGTVETTTESFTGFLQWDHDERLSEDELNGDTEDGDLDIEFGNIRSIERAGRSASKVTLKSGREFKLRGSNDVNSENRGIIVNIPNMGRVDIKWDEFESIKFEDTWPTSNLSYDQFNGDKKISGSVKTENGKTYKGLITYDLDESYNLEFLDGMHKDIEYLIPFNVINKIKPLNREESIVELINGNDIVFEDRVDVNSGNDGVLVFTSKREFDYIPWNEIIEIEFDK